jgi:hypothetical protein
VKPALLAVLLTMLTAGPAQATVRNAAPGGSQADPDCTAVPCTLSRAVAVAQPYDEVRVAPGEYVLDGTDQLVIDKAIHVHGEFSGPLPVLRRSDPGGGVAVRLEAPLAKLSWLDVRLSGAGASGAALELLSATTAERLWVQSDRDGSAAAHLAGGLLRDSVAVSTGAASSAILSSGADGSNAQLRNVTAVASGAGASAIRGELACAADCGTGHTLTARSVVAHAPGGTDVESRGARIDIDRSNFRSTAGEGIGGTDNQTALPVFSDDRYHQDVTSPTVDAGISDDHTGLQDLDGERRTLGSTPDVGADEFSPVPPIATTGPATSVTQASAMLTGRVNPRRGLTTWGFEYGTTPALGTILPGGRLDASTISSAVSASLAGLTAGTAFHYRLIATSAYGTSRGEVGTFNTAPSGPSEPGSGPTGPGGGTDDSVRPALRWLPAKARIAGRATKRLRFQLSERARVTFAFRRRASDPVALGFIRRTYPAGQNALAFAGRLGGKRLPSGRYRVQATPTDAAGNVGFTRQLRLTLAKR